MRGDKIKDDPEPSSHKHEWVEWENPSDTESSDEEAKQAQKQEKDEEEEGECEEEGCNKPAQQILSYGSVDAHLCDEHHGQAKDNHPDYQDEGDDNEGDDNEGDVADEKKPIRKHDIEVVEPWLESNTPHLKITNRVSGQSFVVCQDLLPADFSEGDNVQEIYHLLEPSIGCAFSDCAYEWVRSVTMLKVAKLIPHCDLDFGDYKKPQCGICHTPTAGHFKRGKLQEDIICSKCNEEWEFVDLGEDERCDDMPGEKLFYRRRKPWRRRRVSKIENKEKKVEEDESSGEENSDPLTPLVNELQVKCGLNDNEMDEATHKKLHFAAFWQAMGADVTVEENKENKEEKEGKQASQAQEDDSSDGSDGSDGSDSSDEDGSNDVTCFRCEMTSDGVCAHKLPSLVHDNPCWCLLPASHLYDGFHLCTQHYNAQFCRRPTKKGTPCKNRATCSIHKQ